MTDAPEDPKLVDAVELQETEPPPPMTEQRDQPARRGLMFRLLVIATILAVVCVVIAFVAFQVNRATRNNPIEIEIYPGAQSVAEGDVRTANTDKRTFESTASTQQVYSFYLLKLGIDESRGCKKIYLTSQPDDADPTKWYGRCLIDNSQDDRSQVLRLTVQWDARKNRTLLIIERVWGA